MVRHEVVTQIINRVMTNSAANVSHYINLLSQLMRNTSQMDLMDSLPKLKESLSYIAMIPSMAAGQLLSAILVSKLVSMAPLPDYRTYTCKLEILWALSLTLTLTLTHIHIQYFHVIVIWPPAADPVQCLVARLSVACVKKGPVFYSHWSKEDCCWGLSPTSQEIQSTLH